jgi:predicted metal-dependent phosphoesterase TrpH
MRKIDMVSQMRIDMHTHCLPVSGCAHHQPEELPKIFLDKGFDAIVLTNHCYPAHCDKLSQNLNEQALLYVDTYTRCKRKGDELGIKVFFGVEVKLVDEPNRPEFLLYGISENDFIESYPLYKKTQKELFEFCNKKDIIMVQAHPYRTEQRYAPADMRYVHGVEIYNPHLLFEARYEESLELAQCNGKLKTAGSDFHTERQAGLAGMIVPNDIDDQFDLRDYLKTGKCVIFDKDVIKYVQQ